MSQGPGRRIAILGNVGTGKSTLAEGLGRKLRLPVVHLDKLLWRPGWEIVPEGEFTDRHRDALTGQEWIIEGVGYPSTVPARLAAADTVLYLRYPLWRCYWWALKRELSPRAAGRPDDCPAARAAGRMMRAVWSNQRELLPLLDRMVAEAPATTTAHVFPSPRLLKRWLRRQAVLS